ncbi:CLD22 protein, partial [Polypterus senegalus]|nr:claudin-22 [Polypterus senegalus]MBN3291386.1 CLD22 protein [Polypterus senegalus]
MVLLNSKIVQLGAFFVSLMGLATSIVTTFLPLWKTMNTDLNEMENWYQGLWHNCVFQDEVGLQCKSFDSFLALPADIMISRILMLISNVLGILGLLVTVAGMDCIKLSGDKDLFKKKILVSGGVLFLLSGITTLFPVSMVAYLMVSEFWDDNVPELVLRWEFGEAMFSGWFAGLFLVLGGAFTFVSICMMKSSSSPVYHITPRNQKTVQYLKTEVL